MSDTLERLREALEEARKTFATLTELRKDNSLWQNVARVGLRDVEAALADLDSGETQE